MTMPPRPGELMPAVDEANTLLAPGPATMVTGRNGPMGLFTIRTTTATLTIQLPRADILAWAGLLKELGDSMEDSSPLLVAGPGAVQLLRP
jgi:hypothetical protein